MKPLHFSIFTITLVLLFAGQRVVGQSIPLASPKQVGMDAKQLLYADSALMKAIDNHEIPGAVLAVVHKGKMAYLKAYGNKRVYPDTVKMSTNTIFDMASCSKSMSTAVCTMILVDRGLIRLQDRVDLYIPGFEGWTGTDGEKKSIRIIDLLTHTSGLPAYAPVGELGKKYGAPNPDGLITYISTCKRMYKPESTFQYSCLNFITLQRIIENVSRLSLRDFAKINIFDKLGMTNTDYVPLTHGFKQDAIAPTEIQQDGSVLCGIVHDPLARIMNGGISGNAGVFSNAEDIAILTATLLNGGKHNDQRILSPLGVKAMLSVPRNFEEFGRTLGWDNYSPYASNVGDLLSHSAVGHTGYTGTSIVVDPNNDTAIILLINAVHPKDEHSVVRLRSLVSNAVASSLNVEKYKK